MSEIVTLAIVGILMIGMFIGGAYALTSNRRIPIYGLDFGSGAFERRKLPMNKHGAVTWKKSGGANVQLELDTSYAMRGKRGPEYLADVSEGRGIIFALDGKHEVLTMDGGRLWSALFSGGLKEIADSAKTDLNKTLTILMVGGGVALLLILGAVIYAVKLLQDAQAAGVPVGP